MTINFFVTPNPYSALHSGRAGLEHSVVSVQFFISPAYLILIALILLALYVKKIAFDYKILIAMGFLILSGLYTQALMSNPTTYLYNVLSFVFMSSLAIIAYNFTDKKDITNLKKVAKTLTVILFLGVCLAVLFPNRYGVLPFEFSRLSRGEVTFWNVTGMFVLYPAIAILVYRRYKIATYIFFSLIMTMIILSTATRASFVLSLLPFIIVILFNIKMVYKLIFFTLLIPVVLLFYKTIIGFFVGGDTNTSTDISNGRFDLWNYHWEYLKENPLLGSGAYFVDRMGNYSGGANSEIGALMWFSENGVIFGAILLLIVAKAVFVGFRLMLKGEKTTDVELFFSILVLSMLPNLVQSYGRILSVEDMIFWFSVFFLNAYSKPLFPYIGLNIKTSK